MNRRQFIATSAAALSAAALPLLPVAARAAAPGGLQVLSTMWRGEGWPLALDGPAPVLGNYGAWLVEWQPNGWYRLYWGTDRSRSLDVINDGTNTRLHMAPTGDYSGQYWKFT